MVKFDLYPNDKYDKWFEVTSQHIRLPAAPAPPAPASTPAEDAEKKTPSKEDKIKAEIKSPVMILWLD